MRWLVVAVMGATLAVMPRARAEPTESPGTRTALNWQRLPGAEACPGIGELAMRITSHLKRDPFVSPAAAALVIDASIEKAASGFDVHIVLSSNNAESGRRELRSESPVCTDAVDATALAIALMLEPNALADQPPAAVPDATRASPSPTPPASTAPHEVAAPGQSKTAEARASQPSSAAASLWSEPTGTEKRPPASWRTRLALSGLGGVGQLPNASAGALFGLRETPENRRAGVELSVAYLAARRAELRSNVGAEFDLLAIGLAGLWAPITRPAVSLSLSAGAQLGKLSVRSFGLTPGRDASSWLVNATLELEAALALSGRWEAILRVGGGVALHRDTFDVSVAGQPQPLFESAPVCGMLSAGFALSP